MGRNKERWILEVRTWRWKRDKADKATTLHDSLEEAKLAALEARNTISSGKSDRGRIYRLTAVIVPPKGKGRAVTQQEYLDDSRKKRPTK